MASWPLTHPAQRQRHRALDVPARAARAAHTPQQTACRLSPTAGFHFGYIEQGGSSLYTTLALQASSLEVLRIVVSIGGVEVDHLSLWHDKAGNAVSQPLAGVTDPETALTIPDFNSPSGRDLSSSPGRRAG
jgi:hypothetical protein